MKGGFERQPWLKLAVTMAALVAVTGLAGCVDDLNGGSKARESKSDNGKGNGPIKVDGQSKDLSNDLKGIKVVAPPVTWNTDGSPPQAGYYLAGGIQLASTLRSQAPGAYTTLPWGNAETLSLATGTVTDLFGNGEFAMGRWTDGSDSTGHSYNANQGRVWAIGAPVDVRMAPGTIKRCTLKAATRPTTRDGNTAPGMLRDATAAVAGDPSGLGASLADVTLQYSIGTDLDQRFQAKTRTGQISRTPQWSIATEFLGPDAAKPYLVVSYGVHSPSAGLINGIAVLNCSG
ncbi:MAG: hypothetical protein ACTHKH_11790 [Trinickia sp.]